MGHITDVIAFTADADIYCPVCTERKYGEDTPDVSDIHSEEYRHDGEGNPIMPVFNDGTILEGSESGRVTCALCEGTLAEWCDICEDGSHATSDHGEPLVILDHGRRNPADEVTDRIAIARDLVSRDRARLMAEYAPANGDILPRDQLVDIVHGFGDAAGSLRTLSLENDRWIRRREWLESAEGKGITLTLREGIEATPDAILAEEGFWEWQSSALDDIHSLLGDAGYVSFDHGDAGAWMVYAPESGILRDYYRKGR